MGDSMISIHINDMATAASNNTKMESLIQDLQKVLDLVDMGDIKWFLDMEISCDCTAQMITLSQTAYINTITCKFNFQDVHPVTTPLDTSVTLSKHMYMPQK